MFLHRSRTAAVVGTELALAVLAILATRLVDTPEVIAAGAKTVPGVWPAAAVVAWAVLRGWRGGLLAAAVVAAADLVEVAEPTENTVNNIILLLLLGGCVGYCADLAREGHAALREAMQRAGARCASATGWPAPCTTACCRRCPTSTAAAPTWAVRPASSAAMAAEQERLLRTLVSGVSTPLLDQASRGGRPAARSSAATPRATCRSSPRPTR